MFSCDCFLVYDAKLSCQDEGKMKKDFFSDFVKKIFRFSGKMPEDQNGLDFARPPD
jgi:hypothetical protein